VALRFDPLPADQIPEGFSEVVRQANSSQGNIARYAAPMPTPSEATIAEQSELYTNATAAWERISAWKKVRWSLCAIRTYGDPGTLTGAGGMSGMSLYIKCWLEQRPEADKQPISPCSARVTDPLASPWNYQP
jgi:hypothetical protein